jgi:pilus assembly protein Flp/PilA
MIRARPIFPQHDCRIYVCFTPAWAASNIKKIAVIETAKRARTIRVKFAENRHEARMIPLGVDGLASGRRYTTHILWGLQMSKVLSFLKNESGATAIEYGLIAAGISIAIIAVVNGLGTKLNTTFSSISTQLR